MSGCKVGHLVLNTCSSLHKWGHLRGGGGLKGLKGIEINPTTHV